MKKWDSIHHQKDPIPDGYVMLPRAFDDSPLSGFPPCTRELFLYILRKVNYAPYQRLKRGQGHFTYSTIINDLSWRSGYRKEQYTKKQIADGIRRLKNAFMVETTKVTRGIIVTVCNYDYYQDSSNYGGNNGGNKNGLRGSHGGIHDIQERKNDIQKERNIVPPKIEWVEKYARERGSDSDPRSFFDHYQAIGWVYGKNKQPIKDWQAAYRTWEKNGKAFRQGSQSQSRGFA